MLSIRTTSQVDCSTASGAEPRGSCAASATGVGGTALTLSARSSLDANRSSELAGSTEALIGAREPSVPGRTGTGCDKLY